jgi:hypothetical protein
MPVSTHLEELQTRGVALVRGAFPRKALATLRAAASACFDAAETGDCPSFSQRYLYSPFSRSLLLTALAGYGCTSEELEAPLEVAGLGALFGEAMGVRAVCALEQSWARKRYAPAQAPARYHPNSWHQDGGLGVRFDSQAGPPGPMRRLLTCWLPLDPCGRDRPGLEFVLRRLDSLLHYTELDDASLRRRFAAEEFWAPELETGDGLVFLDGTLHRTHVRQEMRGSRLSVEYRFFPLTDDQDLLQRQQRDGVNLSGPSDGP